MSTGKILFAEKDGVYVLKFTGDVRVNFGPTISNVLDRVCKCNEFDAVIIDLTETVGIDSTALGLLAKVSIKTQEIFGYVPALVSTNDDITRILLSMGFENIFHIIKEQPDSCNDLGEIPMDNISEPEMRKQVLEAHRVLMDLNENNRNLFSDLVEALQQEEQEHQITGKTAIGG